MAFPFATADLVLAVAMPGAASVVAVAVDARAAVLELLALGDLQLPLSGLAAVAFPFVTTDLGLSDFGLEVHVAGVKLAGAVVMGVVNFEELLVFALSSTTVVVLILDKPASELGVSVSLEYMLHSAKAPSSARVWHEIIRHRMESYIPPLLENFGGRCN